MYNEKQRIKLSDTMTEALVKIVEGNPGAIRVIMQAGMMVSKVDPQNFMAEAGPFCVAMSCDALGIYGPSVWMLFKDVCKENLVAFLGVMRAEQLGLCDTHTITAEAVPGVLIKLRERLPEFAKSHETLFQEATKDEKKT